MSDPREISWEWELLVGGAIIVIGLVVLAVVLVAG